MADASDAMTDEPVAAADVSSEVPVTDTTVYCLCDNVGGSGFMIECSDGTGGCNGWFHPQCCGLELTQEVIDKITEYSFTCSLCIAKQVAAKVNITFIDSLFLFFFSTPPYMVIFFLSLQTNHITFDKLNKHRIRRRKQRQ